MPSWQARRSRGRILATDEDGTQVAQCVRQTLVGGGDSLAGPALSLLWASQHLDNLRRLGDRLIPPAAEVSGTSPF